MSPGHIEGLQNLVDPGSICWTRNELDLEQASKASCVIALCGWQGRYTGITAVIFKSTGPLSLYGHQFSFPSNCQFSGKIIVSNQELFYVVTPRASSVQPQWQRKGENKRNKNSDNCVFYISEVDFLNGTIRFNDVI